MDVLAGLILEMGLLHSTYPDDSQDEVGYRLRVGHENVYLWAGSEQPEVRLLGQSMGDTTIDGVGLGVTHKWGKVSGFIEGGWGMVDLSSESWVQHEVNYVYLVDHHAHGGRRIPLACSDRGCYNDDDFGTEYTIDDGFIARVGVEYQVVKHVKVSASYRWMHANEYIAIYDFDRRAEDRGWWEERGTRDFSAFEMGVFFNW